MVSALNNKSVLGDILCDLTKVFDCVHHNRAQSKLDFYQKLANLMVESNRTSGLGAKVWR
jgi:hypothetical protein